MNMIRIIETDTIRSGDLIAFNLSDGREAAGIVREIENDIFTVKTLGLGLLEVPSYEITDIC